MNREVKRKSFFLGNYPTQEAHCINSSYIGYLHLTDYGVSEDKLLQVTLLIY